jgi:hypothetical protein
MSGEPAPSGAVVEQVEDGVRTTPRRSLIREIQRYYGC